ncbi:hypothetical protein AB1Y20_013872 [Prymnesium parvum]|uniref:adenylate cyclase n=1 Tax=Prymnesium parvum TaxID=97485 RepID=A0AB34IHM0_PRYPA
MNCMGIFMGLLAERNRRSNFVGEGTRTLARRPARRRTASSAWAVGAMMYHEQVVFMSTVRNDVQRLLLNTLPEPIVREVAKGQLEVAHRYDDVTVVQADMVGFTPLSAFLSAKEILGILSELFDIFDELVEEHAVHKVKTIGDAYVACCGAFDQSESPAVAAERAVRFALAMQAGVKEVASARSIDIGCRVGVHTGMVMGGIIGTVRFHFDMWGPAVIGALKMEELGGRGRVHVSNATAALLPANWILELVHVMEPDFARTYAIERSHSIVWAPSDDSTRTLGRVHSEEGAAGEAVAAPRGDGAANGEAGMAEASGASATRTMSAKHIEKKLEAEMAQAMAMLSVSGAEGIPKLEGWKLVSTGYKVSHEAGFVQARHARVAQPPPPLVAATKSSSAWPSWGLSPERRGEERAAPRHSMDEGHLGGSGEASRARYLFVSDPQLVAARDTNTPNAKLAEELRAKLHSPQAKDLRAAKKLLLKQCELLLFFSTVFGLYDVAYFWFSFVIRPGAIMGIALLRFAFLLPTLFLLRGIIRKMHRRRFFVDVTGVALVAIPAFTCVLMVAAAPQYALPCAALADTSCAFGEAAAATIPPPMAPPALPSQLDACVKFVRVDGRPELCYSRDISYSYVRTLGMLYAFFGYTHLHTRLHLLVASQTLGRRAPHLTLLGAALFTEWMRLDGLDGEQRARLQSDFILGLVTSAAWLAAAHALGLAHHAMRSQMVRNHFLLHGLQHELLSIIQQETKQCEQLLANILPPNVIGSLASMALPDARVGSHDDDRAMHHPVRAAELYKQRMAHPLNLKAVVADQYSECSFLFAKIGGLTHLVGDTARPPSQVLMVLQHLFDCFDRLADIYKVQKVRKTAKRILPGGGGAA